MRSQLMKTQIAAICDEMLSAKAEISKASKSRIRYRSRPARSPSKSTSKNKSNTTSSLSRDTRRRTQPRKYAIQPLALPITIVPDQSLQKLPHFTMMEKINLSMKETGSVRAFKNISADSIKKQKPPAPSPKQHKAKSLESSLEKKSATKHALPPAPSSKQGTEKRQGTSFRNHQTSSEVPSSNHSLENNLKLLSKVSSDKSVGKTKGKKSKSDLQVEVTKGTSKTTHR